MLYVPFGSPFNVKIIILIKFCAQHDGPRLAGVEVPGGWVGNLLLVFITSSVRKFLWQYYNGYYSARRSLAISRIFYYYSLKSSFAHFSVFFKKFDLNLDQKMEILSETVHRT